jgi:imidazolonepropionase-like amidohydrolase
MANTRVMLSDSCVSSVAGRQTSITALALLFSAFTLCLAGAAGSVAGAQTAETATIVLSHVRLIDGTGRAPVLDATLVIEGNRIAAIHRGKFTAPANARVLDLQGDTVIPGLINAHGHLAQVQDGQNTPAAYTPEHVMEALRQYESYGVTTMLALGLNKDLLYSIRQQQREGKLDGATVFTADRGIGVPEGMPGPKPPDQNYQPANVQEARTAVDEMAQRHADFVKIWVDSGYGTRPEMRPEVYQAVIEEAHKNHLPVAAHVYYLADAKALIRAGVDVLAHSVRDQPVDGELVALMKRHKVSYLPTLTVDESFFIYAEHPAFMQLDFFKQSLPAVTLSMLTSDAYVKQVQQDPNTGKHKADFLMGQKNLKTLYDAGVHIGLGTDSGAYPVRIPGFSEHRELEDMVQAGLTPMEAIQCATRNNAELLHIADRRGTLEVGKRADLIVLAANPLENITNTRHIVTIFHDGRQVNPRVPMVMAH